MRTLMLLAARQLSYSRMDKKAQKKIDVIRPRLQKLRQQLAGAKTQMDDPDEVRRLEADIAKAEAEIEKLKSS